MGEIRDAAQVAADDYFVTGVPASGVKKPEKADFRAAFGVVEDRIDDVEATATAGIAWISQTVRVRSTANVVIASALENGDTLNGVTLATGNHVFLGSQTAPAENGIYTVVASGAASRATFADSAAELSRIGFLISEGTAGAGERYTLPMAAADITVGTTALTFALVGLEVSVSGEVAAARAAFPALADRLADFDDRIDTSERTAAANARAALYGITDATKAALFGAQGVELDFLGGYYRVGYEIAADPDDLTAWSFSRALAGFAPTAAGALTSFATGVPRITNRGLLVEPARTNLVLQSQTIDNAAWGKAGTGTGATPTVSANATAAPDGTTTADQVTASLAGGTTAGDLSFVFTDAGIAVVSGEEYAGSIYLKGTAAQRTHFRGVAGGVLTPHVLTAGWVRPWALETAASGTGSFQFAQFGGQTPAATNSLVFNAWGAQLELGNYPTSYIATTTVAVTRPADAPKLTGLNIPGECTVIVDFAYIGAGSEVDIGGRLALALSDDTTADRAPLFNTADGLRLVVESDSVATIALNAYGEAPVDVVQRVAFRLAADNSRIAKNGVIGGFDADGSPPPIFTQLGLGMYPAGTNQGGVFISKAVVIPFPMDDRSLVTFTGGTPLPDVSQKWVLVDPAADFPARDSARVYRQGGRVFLANGFADGGGVIKDIYSGTNGIDFDLVNAAPSYEDWATVVSLGSATYAFKNEMWRSLDGGVTWAKIINTMPFVMETDSPVLVVDGVILAFPGTGLSPDAGNGVWRYNVVANTWTQIYVAAWGPRSIPAACEFDGAIYLYGGFDKSAPNVPAEVHYPTFKTLNDLWKSTDGGTTWTQINADMPFQPRAWPSMAVFEGELYIIAGFDNVSAPQTNFNDAYKTSDGVTWSLLQVSETFTERHAAVAYVTNGRFFLTSGKANLEPGSGVRNDIWELVTG